jgi:hypothetical protein
MEHTKGPWKLYGVGDRIKRSVPTKDSISLLTIVEENGKSFAAVDLDANARLIAAAPDMLVMIERFVAYYDGHETRPEAIFKISNAKDIIAKVKGK